MSVFHIPLCYVQYICMLKVNQNLSINLIKYFEYIFTETPMETIKNKMILNLRKFCRFISYESMEVKFQKGIAICLLDQDEILKHVYYIYFKVSETRKAGAEIEFIVHNVIVIVILTPNSSLSLVVSEKLKGIQLIFNIHCRRHSYN